MCPNWKVYGLIYIGYRFRLPKINITKINKHNQHTLWNWQQYDETAAND